MFASERREPGVLVPTPRNPLLLIVSAETEDVASAVDVAMYKLLFIARKLHKSFAALLSVRRSCGAVEVPSVASSKFGEEVPIPMYVPLSKIMELPSEAPPVNFARKLVVPEPESPPSPAAERQTPFIAKHPPERSIPLDPVDVADHEIA